jgi:CO/xanthine dehydrogenase FAD-binding subunit
VRSDLADFELASPGGLGEALALVEAGYRPLAGGTDVMVLLSAGKLAGHPEQRRWVDVSSLDELRGVRESGGSVSVGALTTYTELRAHPLICAEYPMLVQAARETGGVAIQNRGTLGGNIANASPAADSPPALLAYGAELELLSTRGARRVPYDGFHTAYKRTQAAPGEIISRVILPRAGGADGAERARAERVHFYRKVGPRRAQAISKVCFAACASKQADARDVKIALGGVAPVPLRCHEVERALSVGDVRHAVEALSRAVVPIDDVRSTARYRRRVAENLLLELAELLHVGLAS